MKTLCLFLLVAVSALAQQDAPLPGDEQQLRHIGDQWKDDYNRKDAAALAALYSPDACYVSQHVKGGMIHGRDAIRANHQRGIDGGGHIDSIEIARLEIVGDLAYSVGTYRATNAGQSVTGRNILVFRKIGGKWLIVAHTSVVPDQP